MSCNLLALEPNDEGKTPTTPTISSVIAGIQVQEAVKMIHGLPTLTGKGYVFEGLNHSSYTVEYTENPDCMSHYTVPDIVHMPERSRDLTLVQLLQRARADTGSDDVVIEFSRAVIQRLVCPSCGGEQEMYAPAGTVGLQGATVTKDGHLCNVVCIDGVCGSEGFA